MPRAVLAVILVVASARGATAGPPPQPIAQAQADLDGDGMIDQVFVGGTGGVWVVRGKDKRVIDFALPHPPRAAQVTAGGPAGAATIAAMIVGEDGAREGVALALRGDALVALWRGPVGPVGRDGDYEVRLEATATGLVRFQRRAGVERCDGEPARLFAEAWDGRAFAPARPELAVPDAAPEIVATPSSAGAARPLVYRATAASAQAGAGDAGELSEPRAIDDGDVATAWRGPTDSRGEFFTYRARMSGARAVAVRIVPGARGHGRATRLAVVGGGKAYWIKVPENGGAGDGSLVAALPEPISSACVTIVVAATRAAGGDTSIAELAVVSEAELAPGGVEQALAAQVAAGGTDGVAAARVLAGRGAAGAKALTDEIAARHEDAAARRRLVAALIENGDASAAHPLAAGLASGDVTGGDVERAIAALAAMGATGEAELVPLAQDAQVAVEIRTAAVRGLGPGSSQAGDALVALAGAPTSERGARDDVFELRRAVIDALARRPAAELIARAQAKGGAQAGDVWRAAVLAARRDPGAAPAVRVALRDVLAKGASYDERYRAIEGLSVGDDADVGAVATAMRGLGGSAEAGALKAVAARGLARNRGAAASAALIELVGDGDPGVRLAAIGALAEREPETSGTSGAGAGGASAGGAGAGGAAASGAAAGGADSAAARETIDHAIAQALAGDHWPEIRRASAGALGARCARPGPAQALGAAADGDTDETVRGDALAALVACRAPGVGERLWRVADDSHASQGLRVRAVDLVVALATPGDAALARALEDRFAKWRGAAFGDDVALALAEHAAVALGRIGDRGALQALVDAAGEASFPELQAAAAQALGELVPCPPAVVQALDALVASDQRNVALAARGARQRCTR